MKIVTNKIIKIICLIFIVQQSFSQENEIYIYFNENSKKFFLTENGIGEKIEEPLFAKSEQSNGNIIFSIQNQMFLYDKSTMSKKVISSELFKDRLLSASEIINYIKKVREKYPMWYKYPSKEYPIMYVVENLCNDMLILYEVNWKYYIE